MQNRESESEDNKRNPGRISSLDTTFTIVTALKNLNGARITYLANKTGLSKSSIHKHLSTLRDHGYVVKKGDEYQLGLGFLDIGGHVREDFQGVHLIKPKIRELANETDETVQFTTEQHGRAIVLFREAGRQGVMSRARVGKEFYMHQTAAGKAILAHLPDDYIDTIIDQYGLPAATENTITDKSTLHEELEKIVEQGYAVNDGESTDGLRAVAVPMFAPEGDVLGAIAAAGPTRRLDADRASSEIPTLIQSVINELELNLKHS